MVVDKVAEPLQPGQKNNKTKRKRKKTSNSSKGPRRCFSLFALYPSPESWSQEGMQEELVFTKQWPPPLRPHHMRDEWAVMDIAQVLRVWLLYSTVVYTSLDEAPDAIGHHTSPQKKNHPTRSLITARGFRISMWRRKDLRGLKLRSKDVGEKEGGWLKKRRRGRAAVRIKDEKEIKNRPPNQVIIP